MVGAYLEGEHMTFIKAHAARLYAVAVSLLALAAHFYPDVPSELILGAVVAFLGLGEAVQRTPGQ